MSRCLSCIEQRWRVFYEVVRSRKRCPSLSHWYWTISVTILRSCQRQKKSPIVVSLVLNKGGECFMNLSVAENGALHCLIGIERSLWIFYVVVRGRKRCPPLSHWYWTKFVNILRSYQRRKMVSIGCHHVIEPNWWVLYAVTVSTSVSLVLNQVDEYDTILT